jgi:hypothetical protein
MALAGAGFDESFSWLSSMIAVDSLSEGPHRITHHFPM